MKNNYARILGLLLLSNLMTPCKANAQSAEIRQAVYSDISIPLRDMKPVKESSLKRFTRESEEKEVPYRFKNIPPNYSAPADPALQKPFQGNNDQLMTANPIVNIDGIKNSANGVSFPDATGDVGPNQYVQVVNFMLQMFDKSGSSLLGPETTSTIWSGFPGPWSGHNDGEAVVLYDENADRWLISQVAYLCGNIPNFTNYELVAISTTGDPTGSYYRYAFQFDYLPDSPKLGVWSDGYYLAADRFNMNVIPNTFVGAGACVMDRNKMLTGDATALMICFKTETLGGSGSGLGTDCRLMLPSDCDGTFPPAGTPDYFTYINDNTSGGASELRIWALHADWTTPANSTFTFTTNLPVTTYTMLGSVSDGVPQTGTVQKLDGMGDRLMFRNQYRNFGTYETFLTCHNVDIGGGIAGVRWYEYRKTGSAWSVYQQSTYNPGDGKSRWLGSIAMNALGDIGLSYNVSGSTMYPSIFFTGRKASDPLNTMTIAEGIIQTGLRSMTETNFWGQYAAMSIDPSDNATFWTTNEYVRGSASNYPWATKIASFKFSHEPIVATMDATDLTPTASTLNGTVNPNGLATSCHFEWGTTVAYGNSTTALSAGSGTSSLSESAGITGLTGGTTYHFRMVAENSDGTSYGSDSTFTAPCGIYTPPFSESFSGTTLPNCWSQIDHQGNGQIWQFGTIPGPHLTGNYAYLNSRGYGSGNSQNADLVSPAFDLTSYTGVSLQFNNYYHARTGSSGTVSYSTDNGSTWTVIQTYTATSATNPELFSQVIPALSGQPQVKFKWNYTATYGDSWAIDDVSVTGTYIPTWSGTSSSDWNTPANWTNNSVPLASANIIIPSNGVTNFPVITSSRQCANLNILSGASITINPLAALTVSGTLTNNAGNSGILISSDATGTGSLMHNTANVPGTIERYISGSDNLTNFIYHFVSVPLTNANASTSSLFVGSYLYDFNEISNSWNPLGYSTTTSLDERKGYMVYYPGTQETYQFAGYLNNGSFTPKLTSISSPGNTRGWNLIPNPYPSSIDWDLVPTRNNVDNAIYIWPSNAGPGATQSNYYSYVAGVSAPPGAMNGEVAVGQSFFVHAASATPALNFTNACRLNGSKPFLKSDSIIPDLLYLQATSVGFSDYTAIRFTKDASAVFDGRLDAYKLSGTDGTPQLSSVSGDGVLLSIYSLPLQDRNTRVPLHFEMNSSAEVHFKATGLESFPEAVPVYLEDRLLKTLVNLREQPEYKFTHNPENSPDRFSLLFAGSYGQAAAENQPEAMLLTAGELHYLEIPSMLNKEVTLSINDALGRQISVSREINTGIIQLKTPASRGVYFIRAVSGTTGWTGKFIY